jgi:hypothetical protein
VLAAVGPKLLDHGSPILLVVVRETRQRDRSLGSSTQLSIHPPQNDLRTWLHNMFSVLMKSNIGQVDFDANAELATLFHVDGNTLPCMRIAASELHETVPDGASIGTKPMTSVRPEPRISKLTEHPRCGVAILRQCVHCVSIALDYSATRCLSFPRGQSRSHTKLIPKTEYWRLLGHTVMAGPVESLFPILRTTEKADIQTTTDNYA